MPNPLGPYWSVMHRRPQDYAFFDRLQPAVFKVMDGGPPDYAWAREHLPDSLIVARDWALSEQHADMLKDPSGTGQRHADEWWQHSQRLGFDRAKTLVLGINEPHVWEPGVPQALREYTIALCGRASQLGLRVGAMQLSVGWPNNTGPDMPPDWSLWDGVDDAIRRNNGVLICHEYWADNGPGENWGWWAGRSLKCPWDVPLVIGECGIDMFVKDAGVGQASRGWQAHKSPQQYAAELADYARRMSEDARFVGCAVFTCDFANREWASFDVEPAYDAILAQPVPEHKQYLPHISTGTPTPSKPSALGAIGYVIAPAGANLRAEPSTDAAILSAIPYGEQVRLLGVGDGWFRVQAGDMEGWMAANLIGLEAPAPLPAPIPTPQPPTASGIIDPLTALAFMQVESGNAGFRDGLLTIRFEVHVFKTELHNDALFDMHFKFTPGDYSAQYWRPSPGEAWINAHGSMDARHRLLAFARGLNDTAALRSTGMGAAQIMGSNHARIGYATPQAMYNAFKRPSFGANAQVLGFVDYVLSDPALADALRRGDWLTAIRKYNGTGQEATYLPLLTNALAQIQREIGG